MFTSEEPTRFGVGCTGSRLMSGATSPEQLVLLTDEAGDSYDTIRRGAGFEGAIASAVLPDNYYHAFVELHIEQGPLLEQAGVPIGVVSAIAAPATVEFTVRGEGGHAGAVLMDNRRDALAAAAQMIVAIEASAQEYEPRPGGDHRLRAGSPRRGQLHPQPCAFHARPPRHRRRESRRRAPSDWAGSGAYCCCPPGVGRMGRVECRSPSDGRSHGSRRHPASSKAIGASGALR